MIWIYRLIFLPALFIATPYYLYRMRRRGGYSKDFKHRFGFFHSLPAPSVDRKRIWLQAVSVGEVNAVGPLIDALQKNGDTEIVLTTTTSTGYAEARKRYSDKVLSVGIFPLDFWLCSHIAWKRVQANAVILTESELWPEHLHRARKKGASTFLVNARMSDKSFTRYRKVQPLAAWLFSKVDHIYAATDHDQQRLLELGGDDLRVTCSGSIKFDVPVPDPINASDKAALQESLGFLKNKNQPIFVLLGSSTWPGEEQLLLSIQRELITRGTDCRLLLVPRHAERASEIIKILESQELAWHQRSNGPAPIESVQIHLADTTGELTKLSQAADLVFIGKSMPPNKGGQTPIEATGLGLPLVMGPQMSNFRAVVASLIRKEAAIQVTNGEELLNTIIKLADSPEIRRSMSAAALKWHQRNQGSSERIAEAIQVDLNHIDS